MSGGRRPAQMQSPKRSRSRRDAEKRVNTHSVCLIGVSEAVPRYMGDNYGAVPVRCVTAKKERTAAQKYDAVQWTHRVVILESVHVPSEEHAKRLKAAIDTILHGEMVDNDNDPLRHNWKDVRGCFDDEFSRQLWWGIVLDHAINLVRERATRFETISSARREKMIQKARGR